MHLNLLSIPQTGRGGKCKNVDNVDAAVVFRRLLAFGAHPGRVRFKLIAVSVNSFRDHGE